MAAMNAAAKTDKVIAERIKLFRYRVPEELYNLEKDPNNLVNLINCPEHKDVLNNLRKKLEEWMTKTNDPMLEAFRNKDDRATVDAVLQKTYKTKKNQGRKKRNRKN